MKLRIILLLLAMVTSVDLAWSVGALFVRPLRSSQNFELVSIKTYDATASIQDHVATTHVDQVFKNEMNQQVEATFIFPLPEGAMITDMYYWFNGKRYRASVREKKEAQAAYDSKIRRYLDPALLQELGNNVFKIQIAPIEPNTEVRFEITYTEVLPYDLGTGRYLHLLKTTGLSPKPLQRLSLSIEAATQNTWRSVTVPYFGNTSANSITQLAPNRTLITFGDENFHPTRNYEVHLRANRQGVEMGTLTYVPVPADSFGNDPFFMSWVLPPDEDARPLPRSIVVTADVSSSMEGERIDQLRAALMAFLDGLNPDDHFNIITFSTNVMGFRTDIVPATPENIALAREFVRGRTALGLTNISEALRLGLSQTYRTGTARVNVFLTDGEPSWGEVNEQKILDSVKAWNTQDVRVFPIAVGSDLKLSLLRSIAKVTGGFVTEIQRDDSITVLVDDHLRRISMPNLVDLNLSYGSLQSFDVLPNDLPNVPVGGRVLQHGRYRTGGTFPVTLAGVLLETPFSLTRDVFFGDTAINNRAVARLWARAKIDELLAEIGRLGERKELVDAIIDLSIRFNILTKYTALYADPDDPNTTSVPGDERPVEALHLAAAPNPAVDRIRLTVTMPASIGFARIRFDVRDALGRIVTSFNVDAVGGTIDIPWDLRDTSGVRLPRGLYTIAASVGDRAVSTTIVIL